MKKVRKIGAAVMAVVLLCTVAVALVGCGSSKDFEKYTFAQFEEEDWVNKAARYQFKPTTESLIEDTQYISMGFPCAINLFADGSVAVWNGDLVNIFAGHQSEDGLGSIGYGWWKQADNVLTIDYDLWLPPSTQKGITSWTAADSEHITETVTIPETGTFGVKLTFASHLPGYETNSYKAYSDRNIYETHRLRASIGAMKRTS